MSDGRRVISAQDIIDAQSSHKNTIEIFPNDIVTAEARDRAENLGIQLIDGPIESPAPIETNGANAVQRGLWRRSPSWITPTKHQNQNCKRFKKITFVGVGGVGANAAHLCLNADMTDEISLIDISPGLAAGTALDLTHSTGISRSNSSIVGGTSLSLVESSEVVLVSAGNPRKPGMVRADLLDVNRRVIHAAGEAIAMHAPNAIVIVVTNPLDEMTFEMIQSTGFPREQVIGMAGTLDSCRFRNSLAKAAKVDVGDVEAITLGCHGDEMVPIVSISRIKGRVVNAFLSQEQIDACVKDAVTGGGQVVSTKVSGPAVLAPAHGLVELLDYMRGAKSGWVPASVLLQGEFGIEGTVLGVPCHLGMKGLTKVEEIKLEESELVALHQAAEVVKKRLEVS